MHSMNFNSSNINLSYKGDLINGLRNGKGTLYNQSNNNNYI